MDFNSGGKKVIERLVEAYGFTTRQALCDHLGVSKSTMATRYMRDIFPADWVLQCVMETGVSIDWLVSGKGESTTKAETALIDVEAQQLRNGELIELGTYKISPLLLLKKNKNIISLNFEPTYLYLCSQ